MQWVIKASKLCNLRCKYCYEWDSLSDPTRMSEDVWTHALTAIRDYGEEAARQAGWPIPIDVVWHGGEPLLLPLLYFGRVVELQKLILPREWIESGIVTNRLQTNLYSVSDAILDFFKENDFKLGVSVDFIGGVRLTMAGRETEDRVRRNLGRLKDKGLSYVLIVVLANHTASNIESVFDEVAKYSSPVRLLPLFSGPSTRPMKGVDISHENTIEAMLRAFELWFEAGMSPAIDPFDECVKTIILKRLGLRRPKHDRSRLGGEVLQIEPDGALSCVSFAQSRHIGNVVGARIGDIIQSKVYSDLVGEETLLKSAVCDKCGFNGPCDTRPIARWFDSSPLRDCPIEKYLCPLIEAHLEAKNFFDEDFRETAQAMTAAYIGQMVQ